MIENIPIVSIVVPILKTQRYLAHCVDSIRKQTLENIEIILVDHGHEDECWEIMLRQASEDPRIKLIHKKHNGYGASCNDGLRLACGQYVAIVESDDFILPEFYENLYKKAQTINADVVKAPYLEKWGEQESICSFAGRMASIIKKDSFDIEDYPLLFSFHASIWSGIYRRAFLKEHNIDFQELPGAAYVDNEFRYKTFINAKKMGWLTIPGYVYRRDNAASSTNNYDVKRMAKNWLRLHAQAKSLSAEKYNRLFSALLVDEYFSLFKPALSTPKTDAELVQVLADIGKELSLATVRYSPTSHINKLRIALAILALKHNAPLAGSASRLLEKMIALAKRGKKRPVVTNAENGLK